MATSKIIINKVADADIPAASGTDTGVDNLYFTSEHNTYITDKTGNPVLVGTGDYEKLINKPTIPEKYVLPTATASVLGGVKVGENLTITDGVLSADAQVLAPATTTTLGGVIVGDNVNVTADGTISIDDYVPNIEVDTFDDPASESLVVGNYYQYTGTTTEDVINSHIYLIKLSEDIYIKKRQTAYSYTNNTGADVTATFYCYMVQGGNTYISIYVDGVQKVYKDTGSSSATYTFTIADGSTVSTVHQSANVACDITIKGQQKFNEIDYHAYPQIASAEQFGVVKIGDNLTVTNGVLSANASEISPATAETLGGIKVGENLEITEDGVLSATGGGGGTTEYNYIVQNYKYHTSEEIVGCWTDGRPIYRLVVKLDTPIEAWGNGWKNDVALVAENINEVISTNSLNGGGGEYITVDTTTGKYSVYHTAGFTIAHSGATFEYTKSTDAENSFTDDMIATTALPTTMSDEDIEDILSVLGGNS